MRSEGDWRSLVFADSWVSNVTQRRVLNSHCLPLTNNHILHEPRFFNRNFHALTYNNSKNMSGLASNAGQLRLVENQQLQNFSNIFALRGGIYFSALRDLFLVEPSLTPVKAVVFRAFDNSSDFNTDCGEFRESNLSTFRVSGVDYIQSSFSISNNLRKSWCSKLDSSALPMVSSISQLRSYRLLEDLDFDFLTPNVSVSTTRKPISANYKTSLVGGLVSRLRLTSGVRLPSDTPIHIICGSQDVIHS